jgi:fructosamine-3-kinase
VANPKIFKELTKVELNKVISNLYGKKSFITTCKLLSGGKFNTTYKINTNEEPDGIILRVAPINQALLFDFERTMMAAEPLFYQLLQAHNIPTSEVIYFDDSLSIINREYIVFKYIQSVPLNDVSVPHKEKPQLYEQLGKIVRQMHKIEDKKFGWKRPGNESEMYADWGTFLLRFAKEIASRSSHYGVFHDKDLDRFVAVFEENTAFNQISQAQMIHADLWDGNVLVRNNGGPWNIAAIIDVDKVIFGDREMEFSSPSLINKHFLSGYQNYPLAVSPESQFRRDSYKLLGNFMYAYIWLVQFKNLERYEIEKKAGMKLLSAFH